MNPTTGNPDAAAEAAIDQALGQHGIRLVDAGQNGSGEQIQNTVDMTGMEGVQVIADPASHFSEPEPQPQQPQQAPQQQAAPQQGQQPLQIAQPYQPTQLGQDHAPQAPQQPQGPNEAMYEAARLQGLNQAQLDVIKTLPPEQQTAILNPYFQAETQALRAIPMDIAAQLGLTQPGMAPAAGLPAPMTPSYAPSPQASYGLQPPLGGMPNYQGQPFTPTPQQTSPGFMGQPPYQPTPQLTQQQLTDLQEFDPAAAQAYQAAIALNQQYAGQVTAQQQQLAQLAQQQQAIIAEQQRQQQAHYQRETDGFFNRFANDGNFRDTYHGPMAQLNREMVIRNAAGLVMAARRSGQNLAPSDALMRAHFGLHHQQIANSMQANAVNQVQNQVMQRQRQITLAGGHSQQQAGGGMAGVFDAIDSWSQRHGVPLTA